MRQHIGNRGDMEKDYWIDRTVPKPMTGIKRTMEALKYIAWAEILIEAVFSPACTRLDCIHDT